jgi:hypothetical protein
MINRTSRDGEPQVETALSREGFARARNPQRLLRWQGDLAHSAYADLVFLVDRPPAPTNHERVELAAETQAKD